MRGILFFNFASSEPFASSEAKLFKISFMRVQRIYLIKKSISFTAHLGKNEENNNFSHVPVIKFTGKREIVYKFQI